MVGALRFLKALGPRNIRTAQTELSFSLSHTHTDTHAQVHLEVTQFAVLVLSGGPGSFPVASPITTAVILNELNDVKLAQRSTFRFF